jgi:hypothetical protein
MRAIPKAASRATRASTKTHLDISCALSASLARTKTSPARLRAKTARRGNTSTERVHLHAKTAHLVSSSLCRRRQTVTHATTRVPQAISIPAAHRLARELASTAAKDAIKPPAVRMAAPRASQALMRRPLAGSHAKIAPAASSRPRPRLRRAISATTPAHQARSTRDAAAVAAAIVAIAPPARTKMAMARTAALVARQASSTTKAALPRARSVPLVHTTTRLAPLHAKLATCTALLVYSMSGAAVPIAASASHAPSGNTRALPASAAALTVTAASFRTRRVRRAAKRAPITSSKRARDPTRARNATTSARPGKPTLPAVDLRRALAVHVSWGNSRLAAAYPLAATRRVVTALPASLPTPRDFLRASSAMA